MPIFARGQLEESIMGMVGNYLMTSEEVIDKIKSNELSAGKFIFSKDNITASEHYLYIDKSWYAIIASPDNYRCLCVLDG